MSGVTSTNVRLGPGAYLALKQLSENTGIPMGTWANLCIAGWINKNNPQIFPQEIQTALTADVLAALGEVFKAAGIDAIKKTSISELYLSLLNPEKTKTST